MRDTVYDPIPEERRAVARAAIAASFGAARPTSVEQITRGASGALIYRVDVNGRSYVLRLERTSDAPGDAGPGYQCMRTAAEAGVAPPLIHADDSAGVAIMEYRPPQSIFDYPTGRDGLMRDLGALVARLQSTPPFPAAADYSALLAGLLEALIASGRFTPGLLDAHREGLARISEAYPVERGRKRLDAPRPEPVEHHLRRRAFVARRLGARVSQRSSDRRGELGELPPDGRLRIGAPANMYLYGKVYLAEFLANLSTPELEGALTVLRDG